MSVEPELDYGDDLPAGRGGRAAAALALSVFFVTIFGTAIVDTAWPEKPVQLLGAEREAAEAKRKHAHFADGSLARLYEDDLRDRSRVRRTVTARYALLKYRLLNEGSQHVLAGDDHWMFLRSRVDMPPLPDDYLADVTADLFCALDRRLASRGQELVLIPVPRKAWVVREALPSGADAHVELDDRLIGDLLALDIPTADLRAIYRAEPPDTIYFKGDTHWTPTAARLAAEAAVRAAFPARTEPQTLGRLDAFVPPEETWARGYDLVTMLGIDLTPESKRQLGLLPVESYRIRFPDHVERWYAKPTPQAPAALSGTSFSHQTRLARMLAYYSGQVVWDGGEPGQTFLTTLYRVLHEHHGEGALKRVYVEFPIAPTWDAMRQSQQVFFGRAAGAVFADNSPSALEEVFEVPQEWRVAPAPEDPPGKARDLARIPAGFLLRDGRGAVGVHLKGRIVGDLVDFDVIADDHRLSGMCFGGEFDVVLPIISALPSSADVLLRIRPGKPTTQLELDTLALVHEPAPGPVAELVVASDANLATLTPAAPTKLGRRAALVLRLGRAAGGPLKVTIHAADGGAARELEFSTAEASARVVLDLGDLEGRELGRIEVRQAGAAETTGRVVAAAHLTGLAAE